MLPIRGTRACNPPETHQNHEHQRTPPQTQGEPGPQAGNCNQPGEHKWTTSGGTSFLLWEEEAIGNNCVLTLVSGTVPDHGGTDDATGVPWTGDTIDRVTVNDDVKLAPKGGRLLFSRMPSLASADVANLDTKDAEDLYAMFWTDPKLTEIDGLDHWDTSNVTNMNWTFYNSKSLNTLDLYGWDTSQVTDTTWMLPPNLKALRLGPKTKLINGAFMHVAPPALSTWTDKSGLTNPAWTGNTSALASRAAGANHEGTYIPDGQANPFPPVNTPVSVLPFTGDKWQTMVKGLMLLLAAGLVLGIVTYARAKRVTSNK